MSPAHPPPCASATADDACSTKVYLSKTTLLIAPAVLLEHWLGQLAPAIAAGALRVAVAEKPPHHASPLQASPASDPASADVEWLPSIHSCDPKTLAAAYDVLLLPSSRLAGLHARHTPSPLLSIRWLRIVLDEGHSLGASLAMTSRAAVASALLAERRWIVSGTPAPSAVLRPGGQLAHLRPLLAFLREPGLGASDRTWATAVQRPLEAFASAPSSAAAPASHAFAASPSQRAAAAASRLASLLRRVACRTRKQDISLKPAVRRVHLLDFTPQHAELYDDLVAHVRRALLLADWADPCHEQSLLHPRNAAAGRTAAENLREAACVAGRAAFVPCPDQVERALCELSARLLAVGRSPEWASARVASLRDPLLRGRGTCDSCAATHCPLPFVTPCGHLLCGACVGTGAAAPHFAVASSPDSGGGCAVAAAARSLVPPPSFEIAPTGCAACGFAFRMQAPYPRDDNPSPRQGEWLRPNPTHTFNVFPSHSLLTLFRFASRPRSRAAGPDRAAAVVPAGWVGG